MKIKHLMIAGCLFTAFTLQSCIKEKDLYTGTSYYVFRTELTTGRRATFSTELPMARATTPTKINESETLVGIAITMTPKRGTESIFKTIRLWYFPVRQGERSQ